MSSGAVRIEIDAAALAAAVDATLDDGAAATIVITATAQLTRSGMATRLIQGGRSAAAEPDPALARLIARARGYWLELRKGELNISQLSGRDGISGAYITRLLRLAFLSPAVVEAILAGQQPMALTARALVRTDAIDGEWGRQGIALLGGR